MDVTIETLRPGDEPRRHALLRQAFGAAVAFDADLPQPDTAAVAAAYVGDDLMGVATTLDLRVNLGGRMVECGGVSGVAVEPRARGTGAARRMVTAALERMHERRQPVSALYPTTASLYRSLGFEVAGWYERRALPLTDLPSDTLDRWTQVDACDDSTFVALHAAGAAQHHGWIQFPEWRWRVLAHQARNQADNANRFTYIGWRGDTPVAGLVYRYADSERLMYDLDAEVITAVDTDALAAAFGFLASHGTTAGEIRTLVPRHLLATALAQVQRSRSIHDWPWMLRLVDVGAAVAARGWPAGVVGRVSFDVDDPLLPHNHGPGVLEVAGGEGRWTAGGEGGLSVPVTDLAALFTGFADPGALRSAGRLTNATDADVTFLRAACAGTPTSISFF